MPYPVTFKADYVEKRSRLTTFFRLLLAIPHLIASSSTCSPPEFVVIIAWFALLFTGRYPQGMYDFVAGCAALRDARLRLRAACSPTSTRRSRATRRRPTRST